MTGIIIEERGIAPGEPPLVIAEIGVNHDGSVKRALDLVHIAARCNADAVKLQIFHADHLMHASSSFASYQQERVDEESPAAMLRKYELPPEGIRAVVALTRKLGMLPLATPFSLSDVDTIEALDLPAIKIASPDLVNRPLLHRAARLGKPLLVSTGAASMEEVEMAVSWLREWQTPFALLHCVSAYPTPAEQANLCWISEMTERFGVPVGYSDHTREVFTGAFAVSAGAVIIEKHLTYDRNAPGPDHSASADPAQFAQYVWMLRGAHLMRGEPGKRVLPIEEDVRKVSRQSLVVARDLAPGEVLTEKHLTVQRPGTGIPAAMITAALGKRARKSARAGELLDWDMLTDAA
jgi:N,N'-diacetyllegionaminate synthase